MQSYKIVKTSYANLFASNSFKAEIVTQALLWDRLDVISKDNNWFKVKSKDGYVAWVHKFYLVDSEIYDSDEFFSNKVNWYWIVHPLLDLSSDNKSLFLSFGTCVPCILDKDDIFLVLPDSEKVEISKEFILNCNNSYCIEDVVEYGKSLLGIPYMWGGKSSFGFDCSGLIQTLLNVAGIVLPRDCSMQIISNSLKKIEITDIRIGDLVYFADNGKIDHVGIFVNQSEYLHSSGYVKISSINCDTFNYDLNLYNKIKGFYRAI